MLRTWALRISTQSCWRWRHLVRNWFAEISLALILNMSSSRRRTAWDRKCFSMLWRCVSMCVWRARLYADELISLCTDFKTKRHQFRVQTVIGFNLRPSLSVLLISGVLSGGPWGRLLSRECVHCRPATHAGDHFTTCTQTLADKRGTTSLRCFTLRFDFIMFLDARGRGFLCVCEADARLQVTGALQTQYGWTGTLHVPVWVHDPGRNGTLVADVLVNKWSTVVMTMFDRSLPGATPRAAYAFPGSEFSHLYVRLFLVPHHLPHLLPSPCGHEDLWYLHVWGQFTAAAVFGRCCASILGLAVGNFPICSLHKKGSVNLIKALVFTWRWCSWHHS